MNNPQIYGYVNRILTGNRSKVALLQNLPASYTTYRTISKVPTVALTIGLLAAPIIASKWSVKLDDDGNDELADYAQKMEQKIGSMFKERSIFSGTRYGWAGFEWNPVLEEDVIFPKLHHLIPDLNLILIDPMTGEFAGYRQAFTQFQSDSIQFNTGQDIPVEKCIHVAFRVEGDNLYGESLIDNIISTYADYLIVSEAATRYDVKMAASQPKIGYPQGKNPVNGVETDNAQIAKDLATDLSNGNGIIYPTDATMVGELPGGPQKWDIGVYEDSNPRQAAFVDRLNYLNTQFVRGLIMTERSILEGQFGTKAESTQHTNNQLQYSEYQAGLICDGANTLLDRMVELNFGKAFVGKVRYEPAPLADDKLEYIKGVFTAVIKDPSIITRLDIDAIMDKLGIDKSKETVAPVIQETVNAEPTA